MEERDEIEYAGNWIEVTTHESQGHFRADVRIAGRGPGTPGRQWAALEINEADTRIFIDRESAYKYALKQAKNFVDKINSTPDRG